MALEHELGGCDAPTQHDQDGCSRPDTSQLSQERGPFMLAPECLAPAAPACAHIFVAVSTDNDDSALTDARCGTRGQP